MNPGTAPRGLAETLLRIGTSFERFRHAIGAVPRDMVDVPGAAGDWSVREIVAHVGSDLRWFAAQLESTREGRPPTAIEAYGDDTPPGPEFDFDTQDGRNAWHRQRNRDVSFAEGERRLLELHGRLRGLLDQLTDADLARPYTIAALDHVGHVRPAGEGEQGWPLAVWIAGSTWRHYEDHAADLEAVLRR